MKQAVIFFTVVATVVAMIRTSEANPPQPPQQRLFLAPLGQQDLAQRLAAAEPLLNYGESVADLRQSLVSGTQRVVFVPTGAASQAQSLREESPQSSSLDLLLMFTVLVGFIGVQLRRAQDHLQRPFVSA